MERHALLFRVKPGSEQTVASILSDYKRPATAIDEHTQLLGTTVFMYENVVVRLIEVEGDLRQVVRHLSAQPVIQAVEEALNPHLAEPREMGDPAAAAAFFRRAILRRLAHSEAAGEPDADGGARRYALHFPLSPSGRTALDALFDAEPESALPTAGGPLRSVSIFRGEDSLVVVLDVQGPVDDGLARLLHPELGPEDRAAMLDLFGERLMSVITNRRAPQVA